MKKSRAKSNATALTALDQTFACCRRIETLAELLVMCDRLKKNHALNQHLVGYAGFMIAEEMINLRQWLAKLPRT